eukprot:Rmarinus@m.28322
MLSYASFSLLRENALGSGCLLAECVHSHSLNPIESNPESAELVKAKLKAVLLKRSADSNDLSVLILAVESGFLRKHSNRFRSQELQQVLNLLPSLELNYDASTAHYKQEYAFVARRIRNRDSAKRHKENRQTKTQKLLDENASLYRRVDDLERQSGKLYEVLNCLVSEVKSLRSRVEKLPCPSPSADCARRSPYSVVKTEPVVKMETDAGDSIVPVKAERGEFPPSFSIKEESDMANMYLKEELSQNQSQSQSPRPEGHLSCHEGFGFDNTETCLPPSAPNGSMTMTMNMNTCGGLYPGIVSNGVPLAVSVPRSPTMDGASFAGEGGFGSNVSSPSFLIFSSALSPAPPV